jgi:hypothetical protein
MRELAKPRIRAILKMHSSMLVGSEALAEQTAIDLTLTVFEIDAIDGTVQIGDLTLFDGGNVQRTGDFLQLLEHGKPLRLPPDAKDSSAVGSPPAPGCGGSHAYYAWQIDFTPRAAHFKGNCIGRR